MTVKNAKLITTVSILTRRLKEGKTYDDFRKAWFHTTGFGVTGKEVEGSSNRMYSLVNVFDPQEIIVLGFGTGTLDQLEEALNIDVDFRGRNPLDDIIEPQIGRTFSLLVAEDDFSAIGDIPYTTAAIGGKETDLAELERNRKAIAAIFAAASQKRDALTRARKRQGE